MALARPLPALYCLLTWATCVNSATLCKLVPVLLQRRRGAAVHAGPYTGDSLWRAWVTSSAACCLDCLFSTNFVTNNELKLPVPNTGTPVAVTKGGRARLFAQGHPLVFNGALDRIVGRPAPRTGDCVVLADGAERIIGWGMYNSVSMYRLRCAA